jgi:E3 ubiquitin-protein ligase BRE1
VRVLKIQNKKLAERLEYRQRVENELREKIEKLQSRKANDDSKLCIVDRYWTQLDEDVRLLLDRFDIANKSDANSCSTESVKNFLNKLCDWDKLEIDDKLKDRVKFTTQSVAKLIGIFDKSVSFPRRCCFWEYLCKYEFFSKQISSKA